MPPGCAAPQTYNTDQPAHLRRTGRRPAKDLTSGLGVDISLVAGGGPNTLVVAIGAGRKTVLFAAAPAAMSTEFSLNDLLARRWMRRPCRGHSFKAAELAIHIVAGRFPYHLMATRRSGLS